LTKFFNVRTTKNDKKNWEIKNMAKINTGKPSGPTAQKLTRHEKSMEERRKRQANALRANLKKRKAQTRQRSESNQ
jgi:hypothetical protein